MPDKKNRRKDVKKLANGIKKIQIAVTSQDTPCTASIKDRSPSNTVLDSDIKPGLLTKWPKLKSRVPAVFLHRPADYFQQFAKNIITMGIKCLFSCTNNYIKISSQSFNDHKSLIQYLEKQQLPYHTFGHPSKRKMKVVIKGLPDDTDLNKIRDELKYVSIPVIRVHRMITNYVKKDKTMLVLAVVPFDDKGKRILKVNQILGHKVTLEPPVSKERQCYRCQKWGHSQRYCHGQPKCVKCGGDHLYKKCERDPDNEPPKCANCGGEHTANFKECPNYPRSKQCGDQNGRDEILSIESHIIVM